MPNIFSVGQQSALDAVQHQLHQEEPSFDFREQELPLRCVNRVPLMGSSKRSAPAPAECWKK